MEAGTEYNIDGTVKLDKEHGKLSVFFSEEMHQRELNLIHKYGGKASVYQSVHFFLKGN